MTTDFASSVFLSSNDKKRSTTPKLTDMPNEIVQAFLSMQSKACELYFLQNKKDDESEAKSLIRQAEEALRINTNGSLVLPSSSRLHIGINSENVRKDTCLTYDSTSSPQLILHKSNLPCSNSMTYAPISKRKIEFKEERPSKKRCDRKARYV